METTVDDTEAVASGIAVFVLTEAGWDVTEDASKGWFAEELSNVVEIMVEPSWKYLYPIHPLSAILEKSLAA